MRLANEVIGPAMFVLAMCAGLVVLAREVKRREVMPGIELATLCAISIPIGCFCAVFGGALDRGHATSASAPWFETLFQSGASSWAGLCGATVAALAIVRA